MTQAHISPLSWSDFRIQATNALKASQPKTYRRVVSLMLEQHFHDHVLLQLQWVEQEIRWYRSVWRKDEDSPKFNNPIEQLKYIGKTMSPTLTVESGIVKPEEAESLLNLLRNLRLNPYLDHDGSVVLDGCIHTLTFYTNYSIISTFQWNYLPEEYQELQKVTDLLEALCRAR